LRALAVTSSHREPSLPDVPTLTESGFPNFDVVAWIGIVAPTGTPAEVIAKLNGAFATILKDPKIVNTLKTQGWTVETSTPEQLDKFVRQEIESYRAVISAAGIKAQ
jgi:tripartite-type tricarboxylate transporter receptor subunit TctC